ncbi:MAG: hypothetical protein JWO07_730 [Candidatus Saccharibacteria bacterium]|nr:hypothetical protein [Candidatus Saccharibacteria bacterium]
MKLKRTRPIASRSPFGVVVEFLPAVTIALVLFLITIACIVTMHGTEPFARHRLVIATVAPTPPAVDPSFELDSKLARQILAAGYPPGPKVPVIHPLQNQKALDAGVWTGIDGIAGYLCNMVFGATLTEVTPVHDGRILVYYSASIEMPRVSLDGVVRACQGGEDFMLTEDELAHIAG